MIASIFYPPLIFDWTISHFNTSHTLHLYTYSDILSLLKHTFSVNTDPSGSTHHYHLVLMDNLMPVMDGVTAARQMRKQGYPFLIAGVTGNVMEDDIAEFLDAGADIVLAKPVRLNSLMKLVQLVETLGPTRVPGNTRPILIIPNPQNVILPYSLFPSRTLTNPTFPYLTVLHVF